MAKTEKILIFPGRSRAIVPILPLKDRSPTFTHSSPKLLFLLSKMSKKISKAYNFDIFDTSPNLHLSPSQSLDKILNLIEQSYVYFIEVCLCKVWCI